MMDMEKENIQMSESQEIEKEQTAEEARPKLIAGRQPVIEALKSQSTMIEKIYLLHGIRGSQIDKIKNLARKKGVPFVELNKQRFRELASDIATQGVIAVISEAKYISIDDILNTAKEKNEPPFILILDEIVDPQNFGALVRTAECAGVHGIITTKHHTAIINSTVARASAGAVAHVGIAKVTNLAQTLDELKEKGIWIVGADANAPKYYYEVDYTMPVAIVIGNEGRGLRFLTKQKCDFLVKIPMYGKVESLNASVAGALIMYEVVRARELKKRKITNPYVNITFNEPVVMYNMPSAQTPKTLPNLPEIKEQSETQNSNSNTETKSKKKSKKATKK
jgi:23S rRNA (guanosine2251-2'-O)-methyltransferase